MLMLKETTFRYFPPSLAKVVLLVLEKGRLEMTTAVHFALGTTRKPPCEWVQLSALTAEMTPTSRQEGYCSL